MFALVLEDALRNFCFIEFCKKKKVSFSFSLFLGPSRSNISAFPFFIFKDTSLGEKSKKGVCEIPRSVCYQNRKHFGICFGLGVY